MASSIASTLALLALLLAAAIAGSDAGGYGSTHHRRKKHHHWHKKDWPSACGYGSVCQDPVMRTQSGEQFYFHGHKDADFCLVSDASLHINAHFIGRRREGVGRDFTWVQAIGVLLPGHTASVSVNKVAVWDQAQDQLALAVDSLPVLLPAGEGAEVTVAGITISRIAPANAVTLQVDGHFRLTLYATPVSEEEDAKARYGVEFGKDCMAHLDVSFEFAALTTRVDGVLGQTYSPGFRMLQKKPGQLIPTMGGDGRFASSGLLVPDCSVSRFTTADGIAGAGVGDVLANILPVTCGSTEAGSGMVCRR